MELFEAYVGLEKGNASIKGTKKFNLEKFLFQKLSERLKVPEKSRGRIIVKLSGRRKIRNKLSLNNFVLGFRSKKRVKQSVIWNYYKVEDDHVECKACGKILKGIKTTNAESHLGYVHPHLYKEFCRWKWKVKNEKMSMLFQNFSWKKFPETWKRERRRWKKVASVSGFCTFRFFRKNRSNSSNHFVILRSSLSRDLPIDFTSSLIIIDWKYSL